MKYKLNEIIEDTDAFGTVQVIDIFTSPTTGQYCYCVRVLGGEDLHLCWEGELLKGAWTALD